MPQAAAEDETWLERWLQRVQSPVSEREGCTVTVFTDSKGLETAVRSQSLRGLKKARKTDVCSLREAVVKHCTSPSAATTGCSCT